MAQKKVNKASSINLTEIKLPKYPASKVNFVVDLDEHLSEPTLPADVSYVAYTDGSRKINDVNVAQGL